jgi:RNA polymerase sigma factor for flagellar operon FliA
MPGMSNILDHTFKTLISVGCDKKKAAKKLGISVSGLYARIRRLPEEQRTQVVSKQARTNGKAKPDLWARKEEQEVFNQLVEQHLWLADRVLSKTLARLPSNADVDALTSASQLGLLDAVRTFDPSRGIKFTTYAPQRIQGAIIDEIRRWDPVPRLARRREKRRLEAKRELWGLLGRQPREDELITYLGWSRDDLRSSYPTNFTTSLDTEFETDRDKTTKLSDRIVTLDSDIPAVHDAKVRELLKGLNLDEQTIFYLYYYKQRTMKQIGEALNLSEGRVSQMHSAVIRRFRNRSREDLLELLT